jgi:ribosomal protein S27AE
MSQPKLKWLRLPAREGEWVAAVAEEFEDGRLCISCVVPPEIASIYRPDEWIALYHNLERNYLAKYSTQCNKCGWLIGNHWKGNRCPEPDRLQCGSCDAGLPMNCTCIDPPKEPENG